MISNCGVTQAQLQVICPYFAYISNLKWKNRYLFSCNRSSIFDLVFRLERMNKRQEGNRAGKGESRHFFKFSHYELEILMPQ